MSNTPPLPTIRTSSHSGIGLWVAIACVFWILFWYRDTAWAMANFWASSDTFAHAFVVPPITLWMIWRKRDALSQQDASPYWWGLIAIVATGFMWLLGQLAAVNALTQFSLVALLVLSVPTLFGISIAKEIAFPLFFLFFSVPLGEFMLPTLMEWTANFTIIALRLTGIPVYREGLQFVIPTGNWSVVEACSGIRYMIASITVGTLFAYLNYHSLKRRLAFVAVSIIVPVLANWVRAYLIVLLGHFSDNKLATGADHLIYGWVFFGLVIFLMFMIGARWSEAEPETSAKSASPEIESKPSRRRWFSLLSIALITAFFPLADIALQPGDTPRPVEFPSTLPVSPPWQSAPPVAHFLPAFENPSATLHESFSDGKQTVGIFIGYYRNQTYQKKLVSSVNVLVQSKDAFWAQTRQGQADIPIGAQKTKIRTAELRSQLSAAQQLEVWQWYWIDGQLTSNDHWAKFTTALSRLLGHGDESAVVILYTPKNQNLDDQNALQAFVTVNAENIKKMLESIRDKK